MSRNKEERKDARMDGAAYEKKEKVTGVYLPTGNQVTFNRSWGGHVFTDDEVKVLLSGEPLEFDAVSRAGKNYVARGRLLEQEFNGHTFWGFKLVDDFVPKQFCGHTFTDEERTALENGLSIHIEDAVSKKGKTFSCSLTWGDKQEGSGKELKVGFDDK